MKAFASTLTLAALATLAACGVADDASRSSLNASTAAATQPKIAFSRDLRPVDGTLVEVTVEPSAGGRYQASVRTAGYDRRETHAFDNTDVVGERMECDYSYQNALITSIVCKEDLRPVDGDLKVLTISANADFDATSEYTATLRTAFFDRITGAESDETKTLATDLLVKTPAIIHPIMCTQIVGILYNPETKTCEEFRNGCQQAAMLARGYTEIPEGASCN